MRDNCIVNQFGTETFSNKASHIETNDMQRILFFFLAFVVCHFKPIYIQLRTIFYNYEQYLINTFNF